MMFFCIIVQIYLAIIPSHVCVFQYKHMIAIPILMHAIIILLTLVGPNKTFVCILLQVMYCFSNIYTFRHIAWIEWVQCNHVLF